MKRDLVCSYISDIEINSRNKYILSVQIETNGFAICIIDNEDDKVIIAQKFKTFSANNGEHIKSLLEVIKSLGFNENSFVKIAISTFSKNVLIIPDELYDKNSVDKVMEFSFSNLYNCRNFSEHLENYPAYILYSYENSLIKGISESFNPEPIQINSTLKLIDNLNRDFSLIDMSKTVFINFYLETLEIIALDYKSIKFYNNFQYSKPEDVLYYLALVCKELELEIAETEVVLLGVVMSNDIIVEYLTKFVQNITTTDAYENQYSTSLPVHLRHCFYNILHQTI